MQRTKKSNMTIPKRNIFLFNPPQIESVESMQQPVEKSSGFTIAILQSVGG